MNTSTYFKGILLYCLAQIQGERSIYSVYHVLKGKKSSQSIQDCRLYNISPLFNCYRSLNRTYLDEHISLLIEHGEIKAIDYEKSIYVLTEKGYNSLAAWNIAAGIPPYLNGADFYPFDEIFWKRFSICFQVLSNHTFENNKYIPISRDELLLKWVKGWRHKQTSITNSSEQLYLELTELLQRVDDCHASIFVERLTGYRRIGKTIKQASSLFNINPLYGQFIFVSTLHYLINMAFTHPSKFPILFSFLADLSKTGSFTHSTAITYNLLQKGYTIEEISFMRELKSNTIEDHIVEITLLDQNFSTDAFVPAPLENKIRATASQLKTKKLKQIKQHHPEASYFQIRLVLARQGGSL